MAEPVESASASAHHLTRQQRDVEGEQVLRVGEVDVDDLSVLWIPVA